MGEEKKRGKGEKEYRETRWSYNEQVLGLNPHARKGYVSLFEGGWVARCWVSRSLCIWGIPLGCAVLFLGPPLHKGALPVRCKNLTLNSLMGAWHSMVLVALAHRVMECPTRGNHVPPFVYDERASSRWSLWWEDCGPGFRPSRTLLSIRRVVPLVPLARAS